MVAIEECNFLLITVLANVSVGKLKEKKKVAEFLSELFFVTLGRQKYLDRKKLCSNEPQTNTDSETERKIAILDSRELASSTLLQSGNNSLFPL